MKSCINLICYSCIFNVQLHVHLKKWTLSLNRCIWEYVSYFSKIRRICVNTHMSVHTTMTENTAFFLGDCFLLAHPVYTYIYNAHRVVKHEAWIWGEPVHHGNDHHSALKMMWDQMGWGHEWCERSLKRIIHRPTQHDDTRTRAISVSPRHVRINSFSSVW